MSYDIDLRLPDGSYAPDLPNPTYNLTAIFDLALTGGPMPNPDTSEGHVVVLGAKTDRPRGLRLLSGRVARETEADILSALRRLLDPAMLDQFTALEPANGWGDREGAIGVMLTMLRAAIAYPGGVWEIR